MSPNCLQQSVMPRGSRPIERRIPLIEMLVVTILLSGCQIAAAKSQSLPQRIIAPYHQPYIAQLCIDTPPLFDRQLGVDAATRVADAIERAVIPNSGGGALYVSYIRGNSFASQADALAFAIPPVAADPAEPTPLPHKDYQDQSTKRANDQAMASWAAMVDSNHQALEAARAHVHADTEKLRHLVPPVDASASDIDGCMTKAWAHLAHAPAGTRRILIIGSDLINNTGLNEVSGLSLAGIHIQVIDRPCSVASVCEASDKAWTSQWLREGAARPVVIRDPQQTALEGVQL